MFGTQTLGQMPVPRGLDDIAVGILPAAFVERDPYTGRLQADVADDVPLALDVAYQRLLFHIDRALDGVPSVGVRLAHGTIGGRKIVDPCDVGKWHRDTGDAPARIVVTWALERPDVDCGHELQGAGGPVPSGEVLLYSDAEHRRPRVPFSTPRVFVSVALYPALQSADLTCPTLQSLRP